MALQQKFNLITWILKQTVGLQHICKEGFILNIKGKQYIHFSDFLTYDNIAPNQRNVICQLLNVSSPTTQMTHRKLCNDLIYGTLLGCIQSLNFYYKTRERQNPSKSTLLLQT